MPFHAIAVSVLLVASPQPSPDSWTAIVADFETYERREDPYSTPPLSPRATHSTTRS